MERFFKIIVVLLILSYFAQNDFLQILIWSVIAIETTLLIFRELRRYSFLLKKFRVTHSKE